MPRVTFGNTAPVSRIPHPDGAGEVTVRYDHIEQTESTIDLPAAWRPETTPADMSEWSRDESFRSITYQGGWWTQHSDGKPAWVECSDWPEIEAALRQWYGVGGRPDDWEIRIGTTVAVSVDHPDTPAAAQIVADAKTVIAHNGE